MLLVDLVRHHVVRSNDQTTNLVEDSRAMCSRNRERRVIHPMR